MMGRLETAPRVLPTSFQLLCMFLLVHGCAHASSISVSLHDALAENHEGTNLEDFETIDNQALDDYFNLLSEKGKGDPSGNQHETVIALKENNEEEEEEDPQKFYNSLRSDQPDSMKPMSEGFLKHRESQESTLSASSSYIRSLAQDTRVGDDAFPTKDKSFSAKPTAINDGQVAISSDFKSGKKWTLSPLDHLTIKQSRLSKTREWKGRQTEIGSSVRQEALALLRYFQRSLSSRSNNHNNDAPGIGHSHDGSDDDDDDVGKNGVKGYQGKARNGISSKTIKIWTTTMPSFTETTMDPAPHDSGRWSAGILIGKEEEGQAHNKNQDTTTNPSIPGRLKDDAGEGNTGRSLPFQLQPYRIPFPYVRRRSNEDSFRKIGTRQWNTNEMTDHTEMPPSRRGASSLLLQRRNRSRRESHDTTPVAAAAVEETTIENRETLVNFTEHQHNSSEAGTTGEESAGEGVVANVKNTTPLTNPLEALERLTRLLEKMVRQLSQFRQKFTLRMIKMTEREDIEQMQNIMKDFDISPEKPIFFIAGGLRKPNFTTRKTTSDSSPPTTSVTLPTSTPATAGDEEEQQQQQQVSGLDEYPPLPTTLKPVPNIPETTSLPVEPETLKTETEPDDSLISRHNTTTTSTTTSRSSDTNSHVSAGNEDDGITRPEPSLSRHTRSTLDLAKFGINFDFYPIPGRSARTENPFDDEAEYDRLNYEGILDGKWDDDEIVEGSSRLSLPAAETANSPPNFVSMHHFGSLDQSHHDRVGSDDVSSGETNVRNGNAISISAEKVPVTASSAPILLPVTDGIIPVSGLILKEKVVGESNDQSEGEAINAEEGVNTINLASPSPLLLHQKPFLTLASPVVREEQVSNGAYDLSSDDRSTMMPSNNTSGNPSSTSQQETESLNLGSRQSVQGGNVSPGTVLLLQGGKGQEHGGGGGAVGSLELLSVSETPAAALGSQVGSASSPPPREKSFGSISVAKKADDSLQKAPLSGKEDKVEAGNSFLSSSIIIDGDGIMITPPEVPPPMSTPVAAVLGVESEDRLNPRISELAHPSFAQMATATKSGELGVNMVKEAPSGNNEMVEGVQDNNQHDFDAPKVNSLDEIKGTTLSTPNVNKSLTSTENVPLILSSETEPTLDNMASGGHHVSLSEPAANSLLLDFNNSPFPHGTEVFSDGSTNKEENRPVAATGREKEEKTLTLLGESQKSPILPGERVVGNMKKVGEIGSGGGKVEPTLLAPTVPEKTEIIRGNNNPSLQHAKTSPNVIFIHEAGIDNGDQSVVREQENDNDVTSTASTQSSLPSSSQSLDNLGSISSSGSNRTTGWNAPFVSQDVTMMPNAESILQIENGGENVKSQEDSGKVANLRETPPDLQILSQELLPHLTSELVLPERDLHKVTRDPNVVETKVGVREPSEDIISQAVIPLADKQSKIHLLDSKPDVKASPVVSIRDANNAPQTVPDPISDTKIEEAIVPPSEPVNPPVLSASADEGAAHNVVTDGSTGSRLTENIMPLQNMVPEVLTTKVVKAVDTTDTTKPAVAAVDSDKVHETIINADADIAISNKVTDVILVDTPEKPLPLPETATNELSSIAQGASLTTSEVVPQGKPTTDKEPIAVLTSQTEVKGTAEETGTLIPSEEPVVDVVSSPVVFNSPADAEVVKIPSTEVVNPAADSIVSPPPVVSKETSQPMPAANIATLVPDPGLPLKLPEVPVVAIPQTVTSTGVDPAQMPVVSSSSSTADPGPAADLTLPIDVVSAALPQSVLNEDKATPVKQPIPVPVVINHPQMTSNSNGVSLPSNPPITLPAPAPVAVPVLDASPPGNDIISNLPQPNFDSAFQIKPIAIDSKPSLSIPGLKPSLPSRPHPEYLDFVSQGVDAEALTFLPSPVDPVIIQSPKVISGYSQVGIAQKTQQMMQNFFAGLKFRRDMLT